MIARLPDNDAERFAVRGEYHSLDAELTDACDDTACQWFKAVTGLDIRGTAHDLAFCPHSILPSDAPWVISPLLRQITLSKWGLCE